MKKEKTLSETILDCIVALIFIVTMLTTLSLLNESIILQKEYQEETIRLQEEQIQILEKLEEKIY